MPAPSPPTSLSLLEQACAADTSAWKTLVALYTPLLHSWLTAAGLQPADRDDITQRVLEILVRQLPDFEHSGRTGAFRAWLRSIVTNFLKEFWRDRSTPVTDSLLAELADPAGALTLLWDKQHARHLLRSLLAMVRPEFTNSTWQAFRRVTLDNMPARVVAQELGLSVNAVLIARSRVLNRLREHARGLVN